MKRLLNFSAAHPWIILSVLIFITILAATTLSSLKIQISAESLTVEDDPAWISQQKNVELFGDNAITVVFFRDENLFTIEKLKIVQKIILELKNLDEIENVTSLFNVSNIRMVDDFISTSPFIEKIPQTDEELQEILQHARKNPMVVKNLISEDGTAFAVNLVLNNAENATDFDQKASSAIGNILKNYQDSFQELNQMGASYLRDTITKRISADQKTIMPWSIVFLVIALAIGMRSLNSALIPVFTALVSIIWTLAGMALLEIPIGVMTSIVPALLIIIGSTEDIHIIAEYKGNLAKGMDASPAIDETSRAIGVAILLTFITTYFGFVSIYTNEITLLKEFGLVASTGLLINFLVTSLSVPAILKITASRKSKSATAAKKSVYPMIALWIFDFVLKNKNKTIAFLIIVGIWSIYGALSLQVNNNPMGYFKDDTEIVSNAKKLHEHLSGVETFSILLETGIEDTFKKVKYLEEIEKIQQYLNSSNHFDKSLSFADFMKLIHITMDEGEYESLDDLNLPPEDYLVREYLNFVKHDLFKSYVTDDYSTTRILVRHAINGSSQLKTAIDELDTFIKENIDPALRVKITGASIVRANGADYMAEGQGKSLILMSFVIIAVIAILFVTWKAGVVALVGRTDRVRRQAPHCQCVAAARSLVDHKTFVLASDGDMMEGVQSEASSLAGHLGLGLCCWTGFCPHRHIRRRF